MNTIKKYAHYLPHLLITALVVPKIIGKFTGVSDPLPFFQGIDILGFGASFTQGVIGVFLALTLIGLYCKATEELASIMLGFYMLSALLLVGPHALPLFIIGNLILIVAMKRTCPCCHNCQKCDKGSGKVCQVED